MDNSASVPPPVRRHRGTVIAGLAGLLVVAAVALGPVRPLLRILSMPLHRPSWYMFFCTFNGIAFLAVAAFPVAMPAVFALAWFRRTRGAAEVWRPSLAEVGLVYGTVPWVWLTLLPGSRAGVILIPLTDLPTMDAGQIIGNLFVLAALGFFVPPRFPALASVPRVMALAAGCSALIETLQYVLRLDRISSVDDVIVNTTGAGLAALVSYPWWRRTSVRRRRAEARRAVPR